VFELLVNLSSPILELQQALLPLKCYKPGNVPQFLLLPLFTFGLIVESIKELGGASIKHKYLSNFDYFFCGPMPFLAHWIVATPIMAYTMAY
jgi:hypothetical protein